MIFLSYDLNSLGLVSFDSTTAIENYFFSN